MLSASKGGKRRRLSLPASMNPPLTSAVASVSSIRNRTVLTTSSAVNRMMRWSASTSRGSEAAHAAVELPPAPPVPVPCPPAPPAPPAPPPSIVPVPFSGTGRLVQPPPPSETAATNIPNRAAFRMGAMSK